MDDPGSWSHVSVDQGELNESHLSSELCPLGRWETHFFPALAFPSLSILSIYTDVSLEERGLDPIH